MATTSFHTRKCENPARREIEIVFKQPAEGLLRQVDNALRSVGMEMTASKVR